MPPITIVLTEGYSDWEIAPLSGLGRAFFGASIVFTSPQGGKLTSAAGLNIANTLRFCAPDSGVVVVCGGPSVEQNEDSALVQQLQKAYKNGCIMAGICGGTVALARAGLLDTVRHTSNAPGYLDEHAAGYNGKGHYVDQPNALRDGVIITAPAPAPASFAVEVLMAVGVDAQAAHVIQQLLAKEHGH